MIENASPESELPLPQSAMFSPAASLSPSRSNLSLEPCSSPESPFSVADVPSSVSPSNIDGARSSAQALRVETSRSASMVRRSMTKQCRGLWLKARAFRASDRHCMYGDHAHRMSYLGVTE